MKKLIILATSVLTLAACSTAVPTDTETIVVEPDRVFTSTKDATQVATCIQDRWATWVDKFEDWGIVKSEVVTDGFAISALKYGTDAYDGAPKKVSTKNYEAIVTNTEQGSESKLYQHFSINLGANPFFSSVDKCQ